MESHPALPTPGPPRKHAEQYAKREHKGAHDYADRPQDARVAGEGDSRGVRVLVLVLAGAAIRSSCNRGGEASEKSARSSAPVASVTFSTFSISEKRSFLPPPTLLFYILAKEEGKR